MVCRRRSRDADRRVVAIAIDALELLRPESDLARLLDSFGRATCCSPRKTLPVRRAVDDPDDDPDDWARDSDAVDEVRAGRRAGASRSRRAPPRAPPPRWTWTVEDDLVAALSELVGFDPGPGVYCLAPAIPEDGVIARAAQRIAQVYGLPLLRYRCLELSLVEPDDRRRGLGPQLAIAMPRCSRITRRSASASPPHTPNGSRV